MAADLKVDAAEQLRSWWFGLVSEIADLGLQRSTWLDKTNQNPHWSYVEFVSPFPDRDQILQGLREGWLTADESDVLNRLRLILDAYSPPGNDHYDNSSILEDPAWHLVAEAASQAKQELLATTTDPRESGAAASASSS